MSENSNKILTMEVDTAFLRSKRGLVKMAEMVTLLVAFVCFAVASVPMYIAATGLEFLTTSFLLLLYLLKLNKRITFFFWPLIDVINSAFATVYFIILSLIALRTYTVAATLVGGILCLMSAALFGVDSFTLFRKITFNNQRSGNQNQATR